MILTKQKILIQPNISEGKSARTEGDGDIFEESKPDWMMDKKYVMGQMIKHLSKNNMQFTAFILNTLRAEGIDWPELDIIEKSIKKELSPSLWKQTLGKHRIVKDDNGELVVYTRHHSLFEVSNDVISDLS